MVDLYHSRRTNFKRCLYYKRDERVSVGDMGVWVKKNKPTGIFYAKKSNAQMKQVENLGNVFELSKTICTIETNDDIPDIEVNDIVIYKNNTWVVDSIQQLEHLKETQFSDKEHYTTIIGLRK